jgi:hypothetical protein
VSATTPGTLAPGRFVWRDLMTTDQDRAQAFYTQLFGWTVQLMPVEGAEPYRMLHGTNGAFGGITPLDPAHGTPSHWVSYITVDDVDAATARALNLGGRAAVAPQDIPGVGRFSIVVDPQGAIFAPFVATAWTGGDEPQGEPQVGEAVWNELVTANPGAAVAFYQAVVGWAVGDFASPTGEKYPLFKRGDVQVAGVLPKPDDVPASMWLFYFRVANIEEARSNVTRLGGTPWGPIIEVPPFGRMAWATDPTGAAFALHEAP